MARCAAGSRRIPARYGRSVPTVGSKALRVSRLIIMVLAPAKVDAFGVVRYLRQSLERVKGKAQTKNPLAAQQPLAHVWVRWPVDCGHMVEYRSFQALGKAVDLDTLGQSATVHRSIQAIQRQTQPELWILSPCGSDEFLCFLLGHCERIPSYVCRFAWRLNRGKWPASAVNGSASV